MKKRILFLGFLVLIPAESGISQELQELIVKPRPSLRRHGRVDSRVMTCLESVACLEASSFKNSAKLNQKRIQLACWRNKLGGVIFEQRLDGPISLKPTEVTIARIPKTDKSLDFGWFVSNPNLSFDAVKHAIKPEVERFLMAEENKQRWQVLNQASADIKQGAGLRGVDAEHFDSLMEGLVACESVYPDLMGKLTKDLKLEALISNISERAAKAKNSLRPRLGESVRFEATPSH